MALLRRVFILISFLFSLTSFVSAGHLTINPDGGITLSRERLKLKKGDDSYFTAGLGINIPGKSYSGYFINPVFSGTYNLRSKKEELFYTAGIDYLMMFVPSGTHGLTEDILSVSLGCKYKLYRDVYFLYDPYFMFNVSYNMDLIRLSTSAIKTFDIYSYPGFVFSVGAKTLYKKTTVLQPSFNVYAMVTDYKPFVLALNYTLMLSMVI